MGVVMAGEGNVKEISASDILRGVPALKGFGEEPTPLQKVGYKLACYVFLYIVVASIVIFVVSFRCMQLPAFPASPPSSADADRYKQLVDAYKISADVYQELAKAQVERATHLFQLVVASTILPAFTAILGYIFGSKKSGE
jgi:uncharacterized membrane protein